MGEKSLELLVNENFVYAKVLDYFGVKFYEERHKTLTQVCQENAIDEEKLIAILEQSSSRRAPEYLDLRNYPVRLIVEYLKHSHQIFIKDTLPYILKKIEELDKNHKQELAHDLKVILPMFVEDFIHHIHEEEDRLFTYVCDLEHIVNGQEKPQKLANKLDDFSIQEFALHHNDSDHDMKGIRGITNQYDLDKIVDPQLRVVYKELHKFDEELIKHANIENDILFPKALSLEKKARLLMSSKLGLN
ncbi:MAG: iron-sulfur cluster repair di-iron protein [Reichenbachiella sp.]